MASISRQNLFLNLNKIFLKYNAVDNRFFKRYQNSFLRIFKTIIVSTTNLNRDSKKINDFFIQHPEKKSILKIEKKILLKFFSSKSWINLVWAKQKYFRTLLLRQRAH